MIASASSLATPETIGLVLGAVVSIGAAARVALKIMHWWLKRQLRKDPNDSELAAIAAEEFDDEEE